MEEAPEFRIIVKEVLDQYDEFNKTKSKIRRSEEGKRLDKVMKKLRRVVEKDESINYI